MEMNLSVIELLKRVAKLLFRNIYLASFLLLCSLPLFCFLIFFDLSLQTTISLTYQFLYKQLNFGKDLSENDLMLSFQTLAFVSLPSQHLSFWEELSVGDLIPQLIQTSLLYFLPYAFLDYLTANMIVAASSIVYTSEEQKQPLGLFCLVRRSIKTCQNKLGGCLITYIYVLLFSTSVFLFFLVFFVLVFFGFFLNWTNYLTLHRIAYQGQSFLDQAPLLYHVLVVLVHCSLFIYLTAKFIKWSAGWNISLVVSVLQEDEDGQGIYGLDALSLSTWYRRGDEKRSLWMMLIFLVFSFAMRMPCLYCNCSSGSLNGNGVLYTGLYVGLICVGNVFKWVVYVVYYHDCKTRVLKNGDVEQAKPPSAT